MSPNKYSEEVARDIRKAREKFETERFKVYMNEDRSKDVQKLGDPELVCFYSNHTTYIAANGDVYPCCYTRHDVGYTMGNILEQSFKEFWFSEKRRQDHKKLVFDTCPACPYGSTNQVLKALYKGTAKAAEVYVPVEERDFFV
jgi:radical SAM protein with 4Fe4S-binding SPASM domain